MAVEYQVVNAVRTKKLEIGLNELAEEGWRVVCECPKKRLILKRIIREEEG